MTCRRVGGKVDAQRRAAGSCTPTALPSLSSRRREWGRASDWKQTSDKSKTDSEFAGFLSERVAADVPVMLALPAGKEHCVTTSEACFSDEPPPTSASAVSGTGGVVHSERAGLRAVTPFGIGHCYSVRSTAWVPNQDAERELW
eukprot:CAMPEP_0204115412 /NCGR_PEP_ID=MMETSP0361-20130328/4813_1 /ASSEMBLY_ACC=CAM_ASM_000343 /TAXON_ID=268821 /ORGANISM="Scrippsiella Hangoei, Strain SHTV-5" /LENGTH=143 /DNA_ID=CAMNT_0051066065 /DNA_START=32 /DNA_END=460 /DNA_ORIENTATION=+